MLASVSVCLTLLAATAALTATAVPAAAAPRLSQLAGKAGCVSASDDRCRSGRGLRGAEGFAVSPDGRDVYVAASMSDALVQLRRRGDGALRWSACRSQGGKDGCTAAAGLDSASDAVVSPDGRHVYVVARRSDAISSYARDAVTGALTFTGCVAADPTARPSAGCADGPAELDGVESVTITPDGASVIAHVHGATATVFTADPATGLLEYRGCLAASGSGRCGGGAILHDAPHVSLLVSADGELLYVAGDRGVSIVRLASGGRLTRARCVTADRVRGCDRERWLRSDPVSGPLLALSPTGRDLLAAGQVLGDGRSVVNLRRRLDTGALARVGCVGELDEVADGCGRAAWVAAEPTAMAVSDTGRRVAVADFAGHTVAVLNREGGSLAPVHRQASCVTHRDRGQDDPARCGAGRALRRPTELGFSPGGGNLYATTHDAIAAFRVQ
jgi:DNA-binding beta-propeller fold protein YncE